MNMKKEELKELMKSMLKTAKFLLLRDGKLVPAAFIHFGNNIDVIGLSFGDNYEKDQQLFVLKKLVKDKNADAAFIVSEAWMVSTDKADFTIKPSTHPMKKECIHLYGECKEGNMSIMQIFEHINGEIIFQEKIDMKDVVSPKFNFGIEDKK
jgi:hypothetical protein